MGDSSSRSFVLIQKHEVNILGKQTIQDYNSSNISKQKHACVFSYFLKAIQKHRFLVELEPEVIMSSIHIATRNGEVKSSKQ